MSQRKVSNSLLTFNQVMNDINTWLVDEDCDRDEVEGGLVEMKKNNSDPTEQFILEDKVTENIEKGEEQALNP